MSHPAYLAPQMEVTEFICILNVVISDVFVDNFPGYLIWSTPTVIRIKIGSYLYVFTSNTMLKYMTVFPTGILLCVKNWIVFVPFWNFPENLSASHPNSFDSPFFQRSLVFSPLNPLNTCIVVSPLCLGPQLCWLGNRIMVNIQPVWPCYDLQL